jgi:succinyl-CoA synthetase beta subunit
LKDIAETADRHPLEKKASLAGLFYHKRKEGEGGNIGSFGYGAGVAMSTMDALAVAGGRVSQEPPVPLPDSSQPANFLDGGGGATEANVRAALDVLMSDPDVKVIFVNSFGGITKTARPGSLKSEKMRS